MDFPSGEEDPPATLKRRKPVTGPPDWLKPMLHWNFLGKPLTRHKQGSKTYQDAIDQTRKKLRRGFTVAEITESIDRYHELLDSELTTINPNVPGHLVGLNEFFGFSSHTRNRMRKSKVELPFGDSWFDECDPEADLIERYLNPRFKVEDRHPKITIALKKGFVDKVLGGTRSPRGWKASEESCFRMAANRLREFFDRNGKRLSLTEVEKRYPAKLIHYIFAALEANLNGNMGRVTPGWLCSNYMFDKQLPAYLHEQAMFRDGSEF